MSDADLFDPPTKQSRSQTSDADLFDPPAKPYTGGATGPATFSVSPEFRARLRQHFVDTRQPDMVAAFDQAYPPAALQPTSASPRAWSAPGQIPSEFGPPEAADRNVGKPDTRSFMDLAYGHLKGLGETALGLGTGTIAGPAAVASGLVAGATGLGDVEQTANKLANAWTYQPRTEEGQRNLTVIGNAMAPLMGAMPEIARLGSVPDVRAAVKAGTRSIADITTPAPVAARIEPMLEQPKPRFVLRNGKIVLKEAAPVPATDATPIMGETQPAAEQPANQVATVPGRPDLPLSSVTPELAQQFAQAQKAGKPLNAAATRQAEAQSLPLPTTLTEGQALMHPGKISDELNARGMRGAKVTPEFLNQQAKALSGSLEAVRAKAAPDVTAVDPIQHGQVLVDSYKAVDAHIEADIKAKYQALRDANGGQFPVDAAALHANIKAELAKELLTYDAPAGQMSALQALAEGGGVMSMEQFLNMRRNLGTVARTSTDGNARAAASTMIKELEKLPLQDGAAALKPLADSARAAAKARFDTIESDPAYAAAVGDDVLMGESSPLADKFVDRYVFNAPRANVLRMQQNLAEVPTARQTIAAGVIDTLRGRAKADVEAGKFAADSYNGALGQVVPKADALFDPQTAAQLQQIGRVAKYTSIQPKGSYANNSGTLVGAMSDVGQAGLRVGAAGMTGGASEVAIHTAQRMMAPILAKRAQKKATSPIAGVQTLKDVGK